MDLTPIVVSVVSSGLVATGITFLVGAFRRGSSAEIMARINEAAGSQVDQLQEEVKEARTAAREARKEADDAHMEMRAVRREAQQLGERLSALARWVHDPAMTIDRLRVMIPASSGQNGGG